MEIFLKLTFYTLLTIVAAGCVFFYCRNFYYALQDVKQKKYSIRLALRIVGVFVLLVGVGMGIIRNESKKESINHG